MNLDRKQLAAMTGFTDRAVRNIMAEPGAPAAVNKAAPGQPLLYDAHAVFTFLLEREVKKRTGDPGREYNLQVERARLAEKQREKLELDMELKRGDFINRGEALEGTRLVFLAIRNKFLAVPSKAAARIGTCRNKVEVEALIEDLVYDVLTECSTPKVLEEYTDEAAEPRSDGARTH